jgi:hypothetical protein
VRVEAAIAEVVRRHESLRSTFHLVAERPIQRVQPAFVPALSVVNASGKSRAQTIHEFSHAEIRSRFDLAAGPLLRGSVLRFAPTDQVILLGFHHIIVDDWSLQIFLSELGALCRDGEPPTLPDVRVQFADFAEWEQAWLDGPEAARQIDFWRRLLASAPSLLDLAPDYARPKIQAFHGDRIEFRIIPADSLRALAREENSSLFIIGLALYSLLLALESGQSQVVVGCPIANRRRRDLVHTFGYLVNTLPLPIDLRVPSFRALIKRVRSLVLDLHENQEIPLARLLREIRPRRDPGYHPLFQVYFSFSTRPHFELPGAEVEIDYPSGDRAQFDLSLDLIEDRRGLMGVFEYSTNLFSRERAVRMVEEFQAIAETTAADPDAALSLLGRGRASPLSGIS